LPCVSLRIPTITPATVTSGDGRANSDLVPSP
jgi:hypothetical protein